VKSNSGAILTNAQQNSGDILVFLTGREDIERCLEELAQMLPT